MRQLRGERNHLVMLRGVQRTVYDRNGQVVRLIRPNEYDPETDSGDGFQFTYDAQGRVLSVRKCSSPGFRCPEAS